MAVSRSASLRATASLWIAPLSSLSTYANYSLKEGAVQRLAMWPTLRHYYRHSSQNSGMGRLSLQRLKESREGFVLASKDLREMDELIRRPTRPKCRRICTSLSGDATALTQSRVEVAAVQPRHFRSRMSASNQCRRCKPIRGRMQGFDGKPVTSEHRCQEGKKTAGCRWGTYNPGRIVMNRLT